MKYSKKELIAKVSEKTGYQEESIAEIYEALEETVYDLLLSANEHKDVEIRLFTGFGMFARWRKDNIKVYREALKLWERVKGRKG